ncbi:unnamed protein product [Pleuronectes platessa]|uniref:Uncharacterized protein n=1 Tax=Pleuronectes platessa TaxID=8262 RepID=A0A9N7THN8_PLEPL|nr:unnamed protein product [Pleuronectes platessa]
MNLEAEAEPGQEVEERHMDMERNYEIIDEQVMESEPQDDVSMFREELSEAELYEMEKSMRAAFQSQYSAVEPLSEEELLVKKDEELNMELVPEMRNEPFDYEEAVVEPLSEEAGLVTMDEEQVMDLEPEMRNEPFQSQEAVPDAAIMDEGQA